MSIQQNSATNTTFVIHSWELWLPGRCEPGSTETGRSHPSAWLQDKSSICKLPGKHQALIIVQSIYRENTFQKMILFYFNRHHDPDRILRQVFAAIIIFCHAAKFTVQTAEDQNFRALGERVWDAFSPCTPFRFSTTYLIYWCFLVQPGYV